MSHLNSVVSSVRYLGFSTLYKALIALVQVSIITRFLSPSEYAIYAVTVPFYLLLSPMADFGVSKSIIYEKEISHDELSSLYWLQLMVSSLAALVLISFSRPLANLYGVEELAEVLIMVAFSVPLTSFGKQYITLSEKRLGFGGIAFIECVGVTVGALVALVSAANGFGALSLAYGLIVNAAISSALAILSLSCFWSPRLKFSYRECARYVRYGGYVTGDSIVNTARRQVDMLLGPLFVGSYYVGLYGMAKDLNNRLSDLFNPSLNRTAFPLLSLNNKDGGRLQEIYVDLLSVSVSLNAAVFSFVLFFSNELVEVFLGGGWRAAEQLISLMAVFGLLRSVGNPSGGLLYAVGQARRGLIWNSALLVVFALCVIFFGGMSEKYGLAISSIVFISLIIIPQWAYIIFPACGVSLVVYLKAILVPIACAIFAFALSFILTSSLDGFFGIFVSAGCGGVALVVVSWFLNRDWLFFIFEVFLGWVFFDRSRSRKLK